MSDFELAQLNVAQPVAPIGTPPMAEFEALLDPVNALAEASPGFVWRLQDEDQGNATSFRILGDEGLIVNMSVWASLEALRAFVYSQREHKGPMRRRAEWFRPMDEAYLALWWVRAGHRPGLEEAEQRLLALRAQGPGPEVFTFRSAFPPPGAERRDPLAAG